MTVDYAVNIMRVRKRATADDVRAGMEWYARAHDIAHEAGDVVKGAGIIAALSPRMRWNVNVRLARVAFTMPLTGGALTMSIDKVNAIRDGAYPLDVMGNGLKTRAFFANILNPDDSETVTVDTHAIKVAGINRDSVGKRMYNDIANGYRECADYLGILPQQIQAITWITYRRELGIQ